MTLQTLADRLGVSRTTASNAFNRPDQLKPALRERVLALAAKVKFVIDPNNPYPNNYTGHIRATLGDGSVVEDRQPHLRGGAQEPLTRQDVTDKFALNAQHGGWTTAQSDAALKLLAGLYDGRIDLSALRS